MTDSSSSYKKILKATSIFGGVQVVSLLISLIRSKFLAIFIGPMGYGIFGLLNSSVDLVRGISSFGLETSGVKKIAEINASQDQELISKNVNVLLKLSLISGVLGSLLAILFSHFLSEMSFGNTDYVLAIVFISISILFKQLTNSNNTVFQGLSKLNYLAKSNLYGNIIGLIITLPLFYFYRIDAIVPAIVITSLTSFVISQLFYQKLKINKTFISVKSAYEEGKEIIFFGGLLAISGFLPVLTNYILQIFISQNGTIAQVGLFSVGLLIINSYVGIIFNAMSTEYYPRLATLLSKDEDSSEAVNQQAIISMYLIVPIIILFIGFSSLAIKILFSAQFLEVIPFLNWAILAMFIKAVSWSMGYIIIAKADSKVFVKTAIIFNTLYLVFCLIGYSWYGLEGLGIGFLVYYIIHLISMYWITHLRYNLKLNKDFYLVFLSSLIFCLIAFIFSNFENSLLKNIVFFVLLLISLFYSYRKIDKIIQIKTILKNYFNKRK